MLTGTAALEACPEIADYLRELLEPEPEYPICEETRQCAGLVCRAFETEALYIDRVQLGKYLALEKYFPYRLFPWERCLFALHNCVYRPDGQLRWPEMLIYVGRGAGKNGYLSFEDLALLSPANGIKRYDIDIFANSEDQAQTTFKDIKAVLDANERKMSRFFSWNQERITCIKTQSTLRFRTSNAKTKDGGRPGKVDFDEYHAYENYRVIEVARTGLGKKQNPRTTIITTDGDVRDGPLDHLLARSRQILTGALPDNGLLPYLCRIEAKDEVSDPRNWHKANPSLRYFPTLMSQMEREYADYKMDSIGNSAFLTKRMNWPAGNLETEVTSWDNIVACSREPEAEPALWVAGIDFARVTDFVSVVLFGIAPGGEWVWKQHTWVCRACKDLSRIRFPIGDAVERGLAEWVDGVEIPETLPAMYLADQMARAPVLAVAMDDYRFPILRRALADCGFEPGKDGNIKLITGKDMALTAPLVISKLNKREVAFGDDALMRWYINNTKQVLSKRGNVNFEKIEPKTRKTDGFMAAVAACTLHELLEESAPVSEKDFGLVVF